MPSPNSNSNPLVVSVGVQCHVGNERTENQDRVTRAATPFGDFFVVADGVGGYQGGAEAAQATVDGFVSYLKAHGNLALPDALQQAVRTISTDLQQRSSANPGRHGMGSTVVLALIHGTLHGTTATYAHAGDSRAYLLRDRQLRQLTRDHSVMERLISQGILSPEQARQHPDASVLTRAIGSASDISLDISELELQPSDALLLCSDGLWAYAPHKEIETVAASDNLSASAVATALLNLALKGGGGDNISIQFLRFKAAEKTIRAKAVKISRGTWPTVALASVLAVSSVGLYIKAHPHWDVDTTEAAAPAPPKLPAGAETGATSPSPTPTKPVKPGPATSKVDEKKTEADKPRPAADKSGTEAVSATTSAPSTTEAKPAEAETPRNDASGAAPQERTLVTVIQGADDSKAEWADRLSTLSDLSISTATGSKECLAQARSSATLFYNHDNKDTAMRIQTKLSLSQSAVVEMSQENLEKCGGTSFVAMPAKPTIGEVIRGKAEQVGAEAEATTEAAKQGIKNRVDTITKKKPSQNPPNTDQPSTDPQNKDPQSNNPQSPVPRTKAAIGNSERSPKPHSIVAGDPSLRLKNGCAQDDTVRLLIAAGQTLS